MNVIQYHFSKMDSLPKDLNQGLLQELECPVCLEYMTSPITMCENGHSICPNCKPKLDSCPSCKRPFLQVRNLALESLCSQTTNQRVQNQLSRLPQSVECPFTRISKDSCLWNGPMSDMKQHVKVSHSNVNDTYESNGVFKVILTGLSQSQHYRKAVLISDELFYIYWLIEHDAFYCAVLYVGEEEKSSKYKYKFKLIAESDDRSISISFRTRCILENLEEIFESGDCVILNYRTVLKFLNSKMYLECKFEINAIEISVDINCGTSQQDSSAESGVHCSLLSRPRRHHRSRRHGKDHDPESPDGLMSVIKPRRCIHGKRCGHCIICRHSTRLTYISGSASTSVAGSPQSIHSPTGFFCAPSGDFKGNSSAEKSHLYPTVSPAAPLEKHLYPDIEGKFPPNPPTSKKLYDEDYGYSGGRLSEGKSCSLSDDHVPSDSTWKCALCGQIAPRFPNFFPEPGRLVASSPSTGRKCKMCGQIRQ